jgi:multidrug efflux pump subunit AcrB
MSPDEVILAVTKGNSLSPSGNVPIGDKFAIVPVNSIVKDVNQMLSIPVRMGPSPVYLRDIGFVADRCRRPGWLRAGQRQAGRLYPRDEAGRRFDARPVVNTIKKALPDMQAVLPPDIKVSFEMDQSPYVTRAVIGVLTEGTLGAVLVGLMVLIFLWDWRSALVVVLNIPSP